MNAIRWVAVLVGSVFLLVLLLLRRSDRPWDSDVNVELANQMNADAAVRQK